MKIIAIFTVHNSSSYFSVWLRPRSRPHTICFRPWPSCFLAYIQVCDTQADWQKG